MTNPHHAQRAGLDAPDASPKNEAPANGGPEDLHSDCRTKAESRARFSALRLVLNKGGCWLCRLADDSYLAIGPDGARSLIGLPALEQFARQIGVAHVG